MFSPTSRLNLDIKKHAAVYSFCYIPLISDMSRGLTERFLSEAS